MSTSGGSACGSRQTPGSSTSTDNSSASGSMAHHKADFGKKHRKIVRILTVIAYVISVSTAALLLSAYYVFIWDPSPNLPKNSSDTTTTMARVGATTSSGSHYYLHGGSNAYSRYNSFALSASQPDVSKYSKSSRKGYHHNTKPTQHQIPTPQSLIMETFALSSTTPQPPFKNSPPTPIPRIIYSQGRKHSTAP